MAPDERRAEQQTRPDPESVPVSPSLTVGPEEIAPEPLKGGLVDRRVVVLSGLAIVIGFIAAICARGLILLIGLITNIAFYQRWSFEVGSPAGALNHLGLIVIVVPVIGGIIVGFMARYGHKAIRGHGIPEAMEGILANKSRLAPRLTLLKPLSSAVAIGTGGPFGAEGPIIATGGALGSVVGQLMRTSADERKILLAAGAAAGMAATFGSPVSAVLMAIELLLFEFRPRSLIPVSFASVAATGLRVVITGAEPMFALTNPVAAPALGALACYVIIGALIGVAGVYVSRLIFVLEEGFERLPVHWMWWPAIGAVAVGVIGYFAPHTLGVGYDNITHTLAGDVTLKFIGVLAVTKLVSWAVSLSSGTSGGTLAPLFTIGAGLGAVLGVAGVYALPAAHIDPRVAAMVGMAALFGSASRTMLTSVIFVFETTLQPMAVLPLLGGGAAAYGVCCLMSRQSIMTEKISRRGLRVPMEYSADPLEQIHVSEVVSRDVATLHADQTLGAVRAWLESAAAHTEHQGYPVVNDQGAVVGVLTRRNLLDTSTPDQRKLAELIRRPPVVVYDDLTLRQATDHMTRHDLGRLPVIERDDPGCLIGIITRSDVLSAYRRPMDEQRRTAPLITLPGRLGRRRAHGRGEVSAKSAE